MQSALDLANAGFKVYLADKNISIGGVMAQLDKTFPTNDCSTCMISPKLIEVAGNPNIEILTRSRLMKIRGDPGIFWPIFIGSLASSKKRSAPDAANVSQSVPYKSRLILIWD